MYPEGVAILSKRTVPVADYNNHSIQEFTMDGKCISCVGTRGNDPLQLSYPGGVAINKMTGQIYVVKRGDSWCVLKV